MVVFIAFPLMFGGGFGMGGLPYNPHAAGHVPGHLQHQNGNHALAAGAQILVPLLIFASLTAPGLVVPLMAFLTLMNFMNFTDFGPGANPNLAAGRGMGMGAGAGAGGGAGPGVAPRGGQAPPAQAQARAQQGAQQQQQQQQQQQPLDPAQNPAHGIQNTANVLKFVGACVLVWLFFSPAGIFDDESYYEDDLTYAERRHRAPPRAGGGAGVGAHREAHTQDYLEPVSPVQALFETFFVVTLCLAIVLVNRWAWIYRFLASHLPAPLAHRWRCFMASLGLTPAPAPPGTLPTSRAALERLKDISISRATHGHITCAICLDDLDEGDRAKCLPCSHFFHSKCVVPWLLKHNSCPTCRSELPTEDTEYESERIARERERARERASAPAAPRVNPARGGSRGGASSALRRWWAWFWDGAQAGTGTSTGAGTGQSGIAASGSASARGRGEPIFGGGINAVVGPRTAYGAGMDLDGLTVSQLKAIAHTHRVNIHGCVEKREIVERLRVAGVR